MKKNCMILMKYVVKNNWHRKNYSHCKNKVLMLIYVIFLKTFFNFGFEQIGEINPKKLESTFFFETQFYENIDILHQEKW